MLVGFGSTCMKNIKIIKWFEQILGFTTNKINNLLTKKENINLKYLKEIKKNRKKNF